MIYSHGNGKISNFLERFQHESPGLALDIILNIYFCNLETLELLVELPRKVIPDRMKIRGIYHSQDFQTHKIRKNPNYKNGRTEYST